MLIVYLANHEISVSCVHMVFYTYHEKGKLAFIKALYSKKHFGCSFNHTNIDLNLSDLRDIMLRGKCVKQ